MPTVLEMIANFAVTYKCNSRCKTCNIWKSDNVLRELSLAEISAFFEENKHLFSKISSIQITGGEPYLRDDLKDIIELVRLNTKIKMIWIATNGLISEKIKRITESLLRTSAPFKLGVTISLDGTRGEHDYQRGIVGSYYNALQTLNALSKLRSQYANLLVSIGMTLTPLNQYSVAHVKSIAEHFNVAFSLRPVNSSEFYYRNSIERTKFDKKALHDSIKLVEKHYLKSEGPLSVITKLRYLEGVERFTEGDEIKLPCSAGSKSFFLDPYGTIYPCIVMDEPLGNIRQSRFSELWSSDHAKDIRLKIKKGQCPGCWLECETYRDISKDRVGLAMTACKVLLKAISM